jgi:hypothetical protein
VNKKIIREVAEDMGLTQEQLPRSDDTPGNGGESTASDGYQADRIVIGYARNYTRRDSDETKSGKLEKTDDTLLHDGDTNRNSKNSLAQIFKFSALATFILIISIFIVQQTGLFSSKDKQEASNEQSSTSATESLLKKDNLAKEEKSYPQDTLRIEERQITNRDKNSTHETSYSVIRKIDTIDSNTNNAKIAVVKKGDILKKIILAEYGKYDDSLVKLVLRANPEISDVNTIFVGQRIILPKP